MKIINLRKYYPQYQMDYLLEVADEIAFCMKQLNRQEISYRRRQYRYKANYSLDRSDGIEKDILFLSISPQDIFEQKQTCQEIHAAISSLPEKQAKRIYAHYFLGLSMRDIANTEGVTMHAVLESIERAHRNIKIFLNRYS